MIATYSADAQTFALATITARRKAILLDAHGCANTNALNAGARSNQLALTESRRRRTAGSAQDIHGNGAEMDKRIKVLTAIFLAVVIIPLLGMALQPKRAAFNKEWLLVNDKPYIEIAVEAAQAAEEWQAEQDAIAESYYYYAPQSVWYESDDAESEMSAKEWIAWRESGGDYNARNGQYIGRYQLSADKLDGDWSEEHQEEVAEAYVQDRYGSWEAAKDFWQQNGWY